MANERRMLLITYDLPLLAEPKRRQAISEAIQSIGAGGWWHHLSPTWLVITQKDANDVAQLIVPHIQDLQKARLLVIEVQPGMRQGWLPKNAWEWIRKAEIELTKE
jgi:hypothetical protein